MDPETFDQCSRAGASRLARQIASYWQKRGYTKIQTDVRASKAPKHYIWRGGTTAITEGPIYTVVSNIGANGFPPRN